MKKTSKFLSLFLTFLIIFTFIPSNCIVGNAAKKVGLSNKKVSLHIGDTYSLKLNNAKKKVSWSSSDNSIVKVNSKGKITAVESGTAKIYAKYKGRKYISRINVLKNELNYSDMTVYTGTNWQFEVTTSNAKPNWTSSDPNVATINKNGYLIVSNSGETTVTAMIMNEELTCNIKVVDAINETDFENPNSDYSYKNFYVEIQKCLPNGGNTICFSQDGSELNRGVKIGDTIDEVYEAFGKQDEYAISDFQKAYWNLTYCETDIVTTVTYSVQVEGYGKKARKSFCFDKYGTLINIYWWTSY